jgi:hypothetical protein
MLTHIKVTSAKQRRKPTICATAFGSNLTGKPNGSKLWWMNYRCSASTPGSRLWRFNYRFLESQKAATAKSVGQPHLASGFGALLRRKHASGGLDNHLIHLPWLREHGHVTAFQLSRDGAHSLRQEAPQIGLIVRSSPPTI